MIGSRHPKSCSVTDEASREWKELLGKTHKPILSLHTAERSENL